MASLPPDAAAQQSDRQNALADVHFASVMDADLTPSEDETPEEKALQLETVQSAIGVSIGQQQTRLTSPKTPAAEKAAALDDTDGGALFEGWEQSRDGTMGQGAPHPGATAGQGDTDDSHEETQARVSEPAQDDLVRLPSPWRATPRTFQRVDDRDHRTVLRDSFTTGARRRAMSGGSASDALRKYIPFNLPSMPKTSHLLNFSLPSFSVSSFDNARGRQTAAVGQRSRISSMYNAWGYNGITQQDGSVLSRSESGITSPLPRNLSRPRHPSTDPVPQRQFSPRPAATHISEGPPPAQGIERRTTPRLRRSNSEGSLLLYRQGSFASSLGDDSRFEQVQEQVNSRLKAIKDSWQDANFKLPSMPSMPNFGFGSSQDMFKYSRSGSTTPRGVDVHATNANSRVSFLANSTSSSRGASVGLSRSKDSSTSIAGMNSPAATSHPHFTRALQDMTGDLVVLGGYRGSVLRSAEPPNRQLWVPLKVGLNLRKVDLELGLNPEDEETEEDRIIPTGMLTHIGPVDMAKRLFKRLRASENAKSGELRVHNYGYDWRLSPHILSRRLIEYLKSLPCNQPGVPPEKRGAIVLAHSLGGLITRHAINQHPELVAGVVYAGVPQTCVNILGPLRNGDDVLLSSRVLTAQVNFTIRTSYALLPLDGKCFINKRTKEEYPVDFFDVKNWEKYSLSPCIAPPLPHPNTVPNSNLTSVSGLLNAMSQALPSLPGRKSSMSKGSSSNNSVIQSNAASSSGSSTTASAAPPQNHKESHLSPVRDTVDNAVDKVAEGGAQNTGMTPHMTNQAHAPQPYASSQSNPATTSTIPHDKAVAYLTRTLADVKRFKQELAHRPEHSESNGYPPIALIYGKSTPTVYGAKVESRETIKRADAYDELAFASGDGVVLARAAMVPEGYSVVRGGVVSSDRGHVTLLGDLEAVGRCLNAVMGARTNGVGLGERGRKGKEKQTEGQELKDGVNTAE